FAHHISPRRSRTHPTASERQWATRFSRSRRSRSAFCWCRRRRCFSFASFTCATEFCAAPDALSVDPVKSYHLVADRGSEAEKLAATVDDLQHRFDGLQVTGGGGCPGGGLEPVEAGEFLLAEHVGALMLLDETGL